MNAQPPHRFTSGQRETMDAYIDNKYPTRVEKEGLARQLGLDLDQVCNYLIRRRKERKTKEEVDVLDNRIKELENQLQQANDEISRLNNERMGLRQENELHQAGMDFLMNWVLELEADKVHLMERIAVLEPQPNDQPAGFYQSPWLS